MRPKRRLSYLSPNSKIGFVLISTTYVSLFVLETLIKPYLWADSVAWLAKKEELFSKEATQQVIENLRPIYALQLELTRLWIGTTGDLRLTLILTALGSCYFAFQLRQALLKCGDSPNVASLVALVCLALPTFQNTILKHF